MNYAVISVVNGTFHIDAECSTEQQAFVNFHNRCTALWNAPDALEATVKIVDKNLNLYGRKEETIYHATEAAE